MNYARFQKWHFLPNMSCQLMLLLHRVHLVWTMNLSCSKHWLLKLTNAMCTQWPAALVCLYLTLTISINVAVRLMMPDSHSRCTQPFFIWREKGNSKMLRQLLAVDIASVCCVLVTVSLTRSIDYVLSFECSMYLSCCSI